MRSRLTLLMLVVLAALIVTTAFWQFRQMRQPVSTPESTAEATPELTPEATPARSPLILDAPAIIHTGDAWSLSIRVPDGQAGEKIQAVLFNGLHREETTLLLGTGGIAEWQIPAGVITQAGQSLAILRYAGTEARQTIQVLPGFPQTLDLLTTGNNLAAYGDGRVMLMALPRDAWGNPPDLASLTVEARFPDGDLAVVPFEYSSGLAWAWFISQGQIGRVRLHMQTGEARATLELNQVPGNPDSIALSVSPPCALADGRDTVMLNAVVADAHSQAVADSTLVTFILPDGMGNSQTIAGQASLRFPAPGQPGIYKFQAVSGKATSSVESLRVAGESCADE